MLTFQFMSLLLYIITLMLLAVASLGLIWHMSKDTNDEDVKSVTTPARIVSRRVALIQPCYFPYTGIAYNSLITIRHFVTFETKEYGRFELDVPTSVINDLIDGDEGLLTYKGIMFVQFEKKRKTKRKIMDLPELESLK